jgi:hypothetical protein
MEGGCQCVEARGRRGGCQCRLLDLVRRAVLEIVVLSVLTSWWVAVGHASVFFARTATTSRRCTCCHRGGPLAPAHPQPERAEVGLEPSLAGYGVGMALILLLRFMRALVMKLCVPLLTLIGYSRRLWSGSWDGAVVLWAKQLEADSEPACEWAPCFQCKPARSRPVLALVVLTLP